MVFSFFKSAAKSSSKAAAKSEERRLLESHTYLAKLPNADLKRRNARHRDDRWTHMRRCKVCEHDNMVREAPGDYRCSRIEGWGGRCPGFFEVSAIDAARMRNMRPEDRVKYESLSDRYDYDALKAKNR